MRIRILCVDDHQLIREGIAAFIEGQATLALVGSESSGRAAIEAFRRLRPDVTLMDVRMPDMDGIQAISGIRREFPDARIIVLTTYPGDLQALAALKAGACGYLLKSALGTELLEAIFTVHAGRHCLPADIAVEIARHAGDDSLTTREIEVLRRVAEGESNKLVARALDISEATVKAHLRSILPKLHATDRTHAVTIALRRGIVDL